MIRPGAAARASSSLGYETQRRAVEDYHPLALGKILPPDVADMLRSRRSPEKERIDPDDEEGGEGTVAAPAA